MHVYEKRFDEILRNIEAVRLRVNQHQIVKIVAASKSASTEMIEHMYNIGHRAFGENRIQDMSEKVNLLERLPLEWHFIGRLQTNKINQLILLEPFLLHSLSSLELAKELDKRLEAKEKILMALLQINSAYEPQKAGVLPEEALDIYEQITLTCKHIQLKGVMSIGAHAEERQLVQKSFEKTYKIFESLNQKEAKYCSMGMSGDYELAVECGSNMLRLGSVLFN